MFKKYSVLCTILLLIFVSTTVAQESWSTDLVAGQNTTIGTVDYVISGDTLTATFTITNSGWCMDVTHFYASNVPPERAAPGQFEYKHENLDCVTSDSYSVPTPDGDVYVAAHADTKYDPDNAVESEPLGSTGTMTLSSGANSYFQASVDVDGLLSSYPAWCVDLEHFISTGRDYEVDVFESGDLLVDRPEQLDNILYVINQDYSHLGATAYDVQTAIWLLIDDLTPSSNSISNQIVADAYANGEGFTPGCGQLTGVFMDAGPDTQNIMVVVPVDCTTVEGQPRGETAWAIADWGVEFGQGWGMYFQLVDAPDDPAPPAPEPEEPPVAQPPAPPVEPPAPETDNGNRARNEEAPGQNSPNEAPGSRRDESRGNSNNASTSDSSPNNNGNGKNND